MKPEGHIARSGLVAHLREVHKMSDIKYMAGLYLRLSKDDERAGESVSIENQRHLLTNYVQEKGWEIKDTYIDDAVIIGLSYRSFPFRKPALPLQAHVVCSSIR